MRFLHVTILAAAMAAGCEPPAASPRDQAAVTPSRPTAVFPSSRDLAQLPALPAPAEAFVVDSLPVDEWGATSAPATRDDDAGYDDASPWGDLARSLVASRHDSARLSPALRCAASELARFYATKRAMPTESLRRYIIAQCGGSTPDTTPCFAAIDVLPTSTDADVLARLRASLEKLSGPPLQAPGRNALGVAASRAGNHVAVVVLVGTDEIELVPSPRRADTDRRVVVRGRLFGPATHAIALVNHGDYKAAPCDADPQVALPEVAFSCRLDDADLAAWMQIVVQRPGRFLSETVADILLYAGDVPPPYRLHVSGPPMPVTDGATFTASLAKEVNRVRAQGQLTPLSLAEKQSTVDARLAGTLVDATMKKRIDADQISLGLLAGWDVDGTIRSGNLFIALVGATRDATVWLDFALERPFGRQVLLDPNARRIAIGPTLPGGGAPALGAVVTTYSLFESPDHGADARRMAERVAAARASLHLAPLRLLDGGKGVADPVNRIVTNEIEPSAATDAAMHAIADRVSGTVSGFYVETNDLDLVTVPEGIRQAPGGSLVVAVTHHRVNGAAWGQYVVIYLLVQDAGPGPSRSL